MVQWEDYVEIGSASEDAIESLEKEIGIKFPDDFRKILKNYQGQLPIPREIQSDELASATFGPILNVAAGEDTQFGSYSIRRFLRIWSDTHPRLIPIASSAGSGCYFALDYRNKDVEPRIVFVDSDEDPEDEDAILFVANSFEKLLQNLK